MKRAILVLAALLTGSLPALAGVTLTNSAPRCRVEAIYTPRFGTELGSLLVRLKPGEVCPPDGVARVRLGGYGGPGSKATGPTETLTPKRPALVWQAQPRYRTVLWEAVSGAQYSVEIRR